MTAPTWLLLVTNLPGKNQTLRMRVWRGLKASGAASLRDGVYLLPNTTAARQLFEEQGLDVQAGGGSAHLLTFDGDSPAQSRALTAMFDRTAGYAELKKKVDTFQRHIAKILEPEARRQLAALRREVTGLVATDFFPGEAQKQLEQALVDAEIALNARFSPDEPHPARGRVAPQDRNKYQARTWATRERLWIDRVCSAWLIRRFVDPKAKFQWLKRIKDCPKGAVGFDFDGAEFTHVGAKVTFEVLLASFALDHDLGLVQLGSLVHFLDVGGVPVAEAAGFAAIMAGARTLKQDDDALLKSMGQILDSLYAGYSDSTRS